MALMKLDSFYSDHQALTSDVDSEMDDIKSYSVYAQDDDDKIGSVHDILVDAQTGEFRYLVVDTGFWIFGKKVLLPVGLVVTDATSRRVYARSLTREQVEALPDFSDLEKIDYDQEEAVRDIYRPSVVTPTASAMAAPTNSDVADATTPDHIDDRDSYSYDRDATLYGMNDRDHQTLKLYQERLVANKQRQKTGEVAIGKTVETQTAHVSVPVEREQVVIERVTPTQSAVSDMSDAFQQEAVRMDVYEETPDIRKETVLREEVRVHKEVERETVTVDETLRREELEVQKDGKPNIT